MDEPGTRAGLTATDDQDASTTDDQIASTTDDREASGTGARDVSGNDGRPSRTEDGTDGVADGELQLRSDPRVEPEHVRVRRVRGARVVLVGVVHDHPSSCFRAAAVVEDAAPDVVALELPELAIPLFEQFAAEPGRSDPGGEMSAAIRAAGDADVRGIDVPSTAFARELAGTLRSASPSVGELVDVVSQTAAVTRHALGCRLAALPLPSAALDPPIDALEYDCARADPPAVQASHEARRLRQSRSLLGAVDPPVAARVTDTAREGAMARRLFGLARTDDVVAIVGFGHLDEVGDALARLDDAEDGSRSA